MGARYSITRRYTEGEYHNLDRNEVEKCNHDHFDLSLGASLSNRQDACEGLTAEGMSNEVSNKQREYITSYGSRPTGSPLRWAQQEFTSPLPIQMKLSPITNLFNEDHMEHLEDIDYRYNAIH